MTPTTNSLCYEDTSLSYCCNRSALPSVSFHIWRKLINAYTNKPINMTALGYYFYPSLANIKLYFAKKVPASDTCQKLYLCRMVRSKLRKYVTRNNLFQHYFKNYHDHNKFKQLRYFEPSSLSLSVSARVISRGHKNVSDLHSLLAIRS